MKQTQFEQELAVNRKAYEELRDRIRREHAGKYVAIAHGRLVAAAPSFDEASAAVFRLQPPPEHFLVFEAEDEPIFEVVDSLSSE